MRKYECCWCGNNYITSIKKVDNQYFCQKCYKKLNTCDRCNRKATVVYSVHGQYKTICEECFEELQKKLSICNVCWTITKNLTFYERLGYLCKECKKYIYRCKNCGNYFFEHEFNDDNLCEDCS